jgi:hypothetical protein
MELSSLNEFLNKENTWTKRLLGDELFQKNRDIQQVEQEYNQDKYKKLLDCNLKSIKEAKFKQLGDDVKAETYLSLGDEIFKTDVLNSSTIYDSLIKSKVQQYASSYYCELGCGYGYNLSNLEGQVYGGEYSLNAVKIAESFGIDVKPFNYYNLDDYSLIKNDTTVFTVHSIEQIPNADCIMEGLARNRDKINYVVHFEPSYIEERANLIGLLRNKYIEINDYNRNLFSLIRSRTDIEIIEWRRDAIGINPLNSANLMVWRFKQ